jgi:hypothetical protein
MGCYLFLAPARAGLAIEQLVLDCFAMLAGPEVVFDAGDRRWRRRYPAFVLRCSRRC